MTILEWARFRTPLVPEGFRPFLVAEEAPSVDGLLAAARTALVHAMAGEAQDRSRAFSLLAADAYLTYSCAVLLEGGAGVKELKRLTGSLVEGLS